MGLAARVLLAAALVLATAGQQQQQQQRDGARPQAAIVGGWEAPKERYPWIASLRRNVKGYPHFCAGTLIAPRVVLSAAHCFWDDDKGKWADLSFTKPQVRIGGHDIAGGGYELRGVLAAALPTAFDPHNTDFDVAVLYLDKASGNKAVRLQPAKPNPKFAWRQGTQLHVAGWGRLKWNGPLPKSLQEVSVDLLSPATCKRYLPRQDWQHNTMMCAGTPTRRRDACSGDSGGPLFRRGASATADVQVGIVSWGVQCGSQSLPGVYTNVASVQGFIAAATRSFVQRAAAASRAKSAARHLVFLDPLTGAERQ